MPYKAKEKMGIREGRNARREGNGRREQFEVNTLGEGQDQKRE